LNLSTAVPTGVEVVKSVNNPSEYPAWSSASPITPDPEEGRFIWKEPES
jgi:hypothetical protein